MKTYTIKQPVFKLREQYMLPKWVSTYKKVLQDVVNGNTLQAMKERRRQAYLNLLSK